LRSQQQNQDSRHGRCAAVVGYGAGAVTFLVSALGLPAAATSCATVSACIFGQNTRGTNGSGIGADSGVFGMSIKGDGVDGETTQSNTSTTASSGVAGYDMSTSGAYNAGVFGYSARGAGVHGTTSTGTAVYGNATDATGIGVYAKASGNGTGVYATTSSAGIAVWGASNVAGIGVPNSTGIGVLGAGPSAGVFGYSSGEGIQGTGINGVVGLGSSIGLLGVSSVYPLNLENGNYDSIFYVDGSGNVYFSGSLNSFVRSAAGAQTTTFSPKAAAPTLEDTGTAQLVGGLATVPLDANFAASIDPGSAYRVFITPDGDTRGLFVAAKTPRGFVVRETQGGRSNLSFDYRIVATAIGDGGKRMVRANAHSMPTPALRPRFASPPPVIERP
jgi:hypothetical protein